MLTILEHPSKEALKSLLRRSTAGVAEIGEQVKAILEQVKIRGDEALLEFTKKFDGAALLSMEVSREAILQSESQISPELKAAMELAAKNIETFHQAQTEHIREVETMPGIRCWRKSVAVERVGLYIPGGSAPLFSTLLMLGIPARIAGCNEVILCTPPDKHGKVHPAILYAAKLTGVHRVFMAGGAQAIAAMAYGTERIPKVDKIFGPGNAWVTVAKQLVGAAIDLPAGPSELAILADSTANPAFMAADLLSQAEHGPDSQVLLVSDDASFVQSLMVALEEQVQELPRKEIVLKAMANSFVVLVSDLDTGMELINSYAPEHLIISCKHAEDISGQVRNAGSVFLGNYSPESAGDYASGTNHTLPTMGYAKAYSGVSLDSFVKKITFQQISPEGLRHIGPSVEIMAEAEGLHAHRNAVSIRLKNI